MAELAQKLPKILNIFVILGFEPLIKEYLRGKYHSTVDLLFDWFGLVCFANKNKNCQ